MTPREDHLAAGRLGVQDDADRAAAGSNAVVAAQLAGLPELPAQL
ncbi:hypothetical protein [Pseudonocardia alaniniphila]|nr:hypothetical protein [Pseudonocardia alaniniphila]